MDYLNRDALLEASDLAERDVDLPAIGGKVRVRALAAAFSNQAASEALTVKTVGREEITVVDKAHLEILQAFHGLVHPKLESVEEARKFAEQCGPSFFKVIGAIDEISGMDKEAIEQAEARFQNGDGSQSGPDLDDAATAGSGGPDVPARTGAGAPHEPTPAGGVDVGA